MDNKKTVQTTTEDLLSRLGITGTVSVDIDETEAYRVNIQTEETGLLIGFHGKTLESLQIILGLIVSKDLGAWTKVYVNVGDYREKREEALMLMAQQAADRAITMGRPVELSRLSASERRVIHLTLSGDERVETESVGEGLHRVLLVKPKVA
ncbi:MAG TPA: R3H domain-containing nucleic acid-binding protein [Patescibacteria group bacterium]|nr:R3H domain-containing nucleic acid-binding protein [Patescibacteria group bacterium]